MGSGSYSLNSRSLRSTTMGYDTKSREEIFVQRRIHDALDPRDLKIREARDSAEHPNSLAIVIGLDVTGSMGRIPHAMVKDGLPKLMGSIIQHGIADPQLLFAAIGDHECDQAPLQVGQFESSDELIDQCLTNIYLESGGGGNAGESYLLAWYLAGYHTSIDCFEKRKQKGFLFTIGDEPTLRNLPKNSVRKIMGDGQYDDFSAVNLLDKARETFNVYHIHVNHGSRSTETTSSWKELMGENLIIVDDYNDIPKVISKLILENATKTPVSLPSDSNDKPNKIVKEDEEIIL